MPILGITVLGTQLEAFTQIPHPEPRRCRSNNCPAIMASCARGQHPLQKWTCLQTCTQYDLGRNAHVTVQTLTKKTRPRPCTSRHQPLAEPILHWIGMDELRLLEHILDAVRVHNVLYLKRLFYLGISQQDSCGVRLPSALAIMKRLTPSRWTSTIMHNEQLALSPGIPENPKSGQTVGTQSSVLFFFDGSVRSRTHALHQDLRKDVIFDQNRKGPCTLLTGCLLRLARAQAHRHGDGITSPAVTIFLINSGRVTDSKSFLVELIN